MAEFTLTGNVIIGVGEKPAEENQQMLKSRPNGFWQGLLSELKVSFSTPFESDWEKKTGLHWRDWGKL